jgi:mutator protein MutT
MDHRESVDSAAMSGSMVTRVGIALVRRGGCFLARVRPGGAPLAGYWEFPGGKCEPGESPEDAARRECREELAMTVELVATRSILTHAYPHANVELHVFDALPDPRSSEPSAGSGFSWEPAGELARRRFPEANGPILEALSREFPDLEAGGSG